LTQGFLSLKGLGNLAPARFWNSSTCKC